ncbi:MAG: hypothetical protein AAF570_18045, partial [Bacteroidota bacterium]
MGSGWQVIARIILKARIPILVVVTLATAFMWFNRSTERAHDFGKVIPQNDPDFVAYQNFRAEFGDDGNVLVIGYQGDLFSKKFFNAVYDLTEDCKRLDGVTAVLSMTNTATLEVDTSLEAFTYRSVVPFRLKDRAEFQQVRSKLYGYWASKDAFHAYKKELFLPAKTDADMAEIEKRLRSLPFYRGLLFNDSL